MIIFHEGLPRSGKSYEAMVKHVLEALKQGRKVFAYVEGLNHEKIAEVIEKPVEYVRDMLIYISPEQVKTIHDHVENDALVVIDELQDFFPAGRQKLTEPMTQFVTQHGHRGLDILAMGQDLRDCHNLWKRRVQRKVTFTKLSAVGMENRYTWVMYEAITGEKFKKISSGQGKYDPQYFGIYKSHSDGTGNTGNYSDDRANIFKTPGFKYGVPAAVVGLVLGVNYLVGFFNNGFQPDSGREPAVEVVEEAPRQHDNRAVQVHTVPSGPAVNAQTDQANRKPPEPEPIDYLDRIANDYRLRLAGIIDGANGEVFGRVEALDSTIRLKEMFTLKDIRALGWNVERHEYGLLITKTDGERTVKHVVRPWPIDPFGRVSQAQQRHL